MTNTETPNDVITRVFASLADTADRDAYIAALRSRGWTLDAIAQAANLDRVSVRRIESKTPLSSALDLIVRGYPLPEQSVPSSPASGRSSSWAPDPSPETLARLIALKPLASLVRSSSPLYRKESEEYTALLNHAITEEGTTVYRLAKLLGVTHGALYFRLTRYGYRAAPASKSKVYQSIKPSNRYKGE